MILKKSITPRPVIFWGWWCEDDHTMEDFELLVEESQTSTYVNDRGLTLGCVITIHQGTVVVTEPEGILMQVAQLLSSTVGMFGLLTTIPNVIFVATPNLRKLKPVDLTLFIERVLWRGRIVQGTHERALYKLAALPNDASLAREQQCGVARKICPSSAGNGCTQAKVGVLREYPLSPHR